MTAASLDWLVLGVIALGVVGQCVYMVALARRAYLADRLIAVCGDTKRAHDHVARLERLADERLAGALSAELFNRRNTTK